LLNLMDLLQTVGAGHGAVNFLAADQLVHSPKLYAMVMLWLLSQLLSSSNDIRASPTASSPIRPGADGGNPGPAFLS
jgi:hypothetical protein